MRIGELASQTGVSVRILRHYETRGLLTSQRLANGYRDYPAHVVERVTWIRDLLACGFGTREIRAFLPCLENGTGTHQCIDRHRAKLRELDELIDILTERRRRLAERVALLSGPAPPPAE